MSAKSSELVRQHDPGDTMREVARLRASLMESITLHTAIFEKLLFQRDDLPLDLAELLEDVGSRYLTFSESISRLHLARRSEIEQGPHPGIEPVRGVL